LRFLVLELAVVEDLADGRVGVRRNLDEVEIELAGDVECLGQRLDAELRAVWSDESDFAGSDAVVDPRLVGRRRDYWCSLRGKGCSSRLRMGRSRKPDAHAPGALPSAWDGKGARGTSVDHGAPVDLSDLAAGWGTAMSW